MSYPKSGPRPLREVRRLRSERRTLMLRKTIHVKILGALRRRYGFSYLERGPEYARQVVITFKCHYEGEFYYV